MVYAVKFQGCIFLMKLKLQNILFRAFITSQVWVAFCLTLLCYFFQWVNGWENDALLFLSFFATIFSYNLAHWVMHKSDYWRLFLMLLSVVGCVWLGSELSLRTLWILLILGGISVLYSVPIMDKNLRNIPFLKMFWIALVWSVTAILPFFEHGDFVWWKILLQALSVFCFVVAITIPFDIRDMELDHAEMQTIPQKLGLQQSVYLGYLMLFLSAAFFSMTHNFEVNYFVIAFSVAIALAVVALSISKSKTDIWFTAFWVEGLSAVPYLMLFFLE